MTNQKLLPLACCLLSVLGVACDSDEPAQSPTPSNAGRAGSEAKPADSDASPASPTQSPAANPDPSGAKDPGANTSTPADPSSGAPEPNQPPAADSGKVDHTSDIRGLCKIDSGYPDDRACIPAPPEGEGMQIHVGPSDYTDAEDVAKYILKPGEESSECWTLRTPNDEEIVYQTSMFSGRAGTHHIIDTMFEGDIPLGGFTRCADGSGRTNSEVRQIGSIPGASKPFMRRGHVAPEYAHVGRKIPANALVQADMHYYNFTDKDLIREFWLNIYYAEQEEITETANQIGCLGGFGWNENPIQPNTDQVFKYQCPIKGNGYILALLGHYHAHGKRFTALLQRGSNAPEKVFEMFDYMDPATFEYNSVVTNPTFAEGTAGALSGQLAVSDGDILHWECHIVNDSDVALKYVNEVKTGEMCNLWGTSVGTEPISGYAR